MDWRLARYAQSLAPRRTKAADGGRTVLTPSSVPMSELGQSLPKRDVRATSAFPLIATELRTSLHVSNVPILLQKSKIERDQKSREC
jgi:hypothetical protein